MTNNDFSVEFSVPVNNAIDWFLSGCPDVVELKPLKVEPSYKVHNKKVYSYNGFTGSLSEVCKKFNVKYSTVYGRINRGFSIEDAIEGNMKPIRQPKLYEYEGFSGSLNDLCEHFGINFKTAYNKIGRGKSLEEVVHEGLRISLAKKSKESKKKKVKVYSKVELESGIIVEHNEMGYFYNGLNVNLSALCRIMNLNYNKINSKIKAGHSLADAIMPKEDPIFTVKGKTGTLRELAEMFGVKYSVVYSRLYQGQSLERALEVPITDRVYKYKDFEGKLGTLCVTFGANYNTVLMKLRLGCSIDEAVEFSLKKLGKM